MCKTLNDKDILILYSITAFSKLYLEECLEFRGVKCSSLTLNFSDKNNIAVNESLPAIIIILNNLFPNLNSCFSKDPKKLI